VVSFVCYFMVDPGVSSTPWYLVLNGLRHDMRCSRTKICSDSTGQRKNAGVLR
jgi:hypothetical protein